MFTSADRKLLVVGHERVQFARVGQADGRGEVDGVKRGDSGWAANHA